MPQLVPIALWSWVPITLFLFRSLPPRRAAIACLIGGWLLLPTARFADSTAGEAFPFWIMPACVAADVWTTKARIIGVSCLIGVMAFDPDCWRRFRPSWWDLPVLAWALCPVASGWSNDLPMGAYLADSAYLALSWGVPYLMGRVYFSDSTGLDDLAWGVVLGGLACLPGSALECASGPRLYAALYGFHPYQFDGTPRYVGSRPILFFEHGNQLGTWLATSALVAAWLWRSGRLPGLWRLPGWSLAAALVAQAVLAQSVGAIALLAAGLLLMEAGYRADRLWPLAVPAILALAFLGLRATNAVDAKALAMRSAAGREIVRALVATDRGSLGWRMRIEERASRLALERPVEGRGRWDWWKPAGMRPWGLPGLVLGQYGLIGWGASLAALAAPGLRFLKLGRPSAWTSTSRASAAALAGAWALNVADSALNATLILPMLAAGGGLVGLAENAGRASAWLSSGGARSAPRGRSRR